MKGESTMQVRKLAIIGIVLGALICGLAFGGGGVREDNLRKLRKGLEKLNKEYGMWVPENERR